MLSPNRRDGIWGQVRFTGDVSRLKATGSKRNKLGRSRTSAVASTNHLDALRADVRSVVEAQAASRGVRLIDVRVISPTEAFIP